MKKILILLLLFVVSTAFAPPPKTFKDIVGVQLYCFRNVIANDFDAGLAMVKNLGLTTVEGYGIDESKVPLSLYKSTLAKYGLKPMGWTADFATLQNPEALRKRISQAKSLGIKYIITYWIDHQGDDFTEADAQKTIAVFNKAGRAIRAAGLQFTYHIHGYEFRPYKNGTLFDYIYQQTDPKAVQFELDTFWAFWGGQDPVQFVKKYGSRTPLFHLKDCVKGVTGNNTGHAPEEYDVPLGSGQVDIAGVLRAAHKRGFAKYYIIEDESVNVPQSISQSLAYLGTISL